MGSLLKDLLVVLCVNFIYLKNLNIENKNLKYLNIFKKEKILFTQEKLSLKDKSIK